jgi:hypothetical protein
VKIDSACVRCRDLLPEYAAGTLASGARAEVERHLATCAACARERAEWAGLAGAVRRERGAVTPELSLPASWHLLASRLAEPLPATATGGDVVARIGPPRETPMPDAAAPAAPRAAALVAVCQHVGGVIGGQTRLLRPAVWIASGLGIALAVLYALTLPRVVGEQDVLAFALPLITAAGIAFLYGPEVDAGLELALATPTSARLVLLGRFALLFGYDTALALGGTLLLSIARHDGFASLASVWFGPMALLATLSLALSLILGPAVAVGGAAALWLSRMLRLDNGLSLHISASAFGKTTPQILVLSLALLAVALLWAPHEERLRLIDER